MRLNTKDESLHTSLIESDLALKWRSVWYPAEGHWSGDYDLTFSRGPQGAISLMTDVAAAGAIATVFPTLIAVDTAFLGLTIGRHAVEKLAEMGKGLTGVTAAAYPTSDPGHFIPDEWETEWDILIKRFQVEFWRYKPFPNATTGWKGDFFGHGSWEIGMRNVTLLDLAIWSITPGIYGVATGTATLAEYAAGWGLGKAFKKLTQSDAMISGAAPALQGLQRGGIHLGDQIGRGWRHQSGQISAGTRDLGTQIKGGWDYYGGKASGGWKHYGGQISGGAKYYGGKASSTWKGAGAKASDTWKSLTGGGGGGGGGGCFLTTACVNALSLRESDRVLNALRAFRDRFLLSSRSGAALVGEYYALAPQIVSRIDASPDPESEYESIYRGVVLPTYRCISDGRLNEAVRIYERGVKVLASTWLPEMKAALSPDGGPRKVLREDQCIAALGPKS